MAMQIYVLLDSGKVAAFSTLDGAMAAVEEITDWIMIRDDDGKPSLWQSADDSIAIEISRVTLDESAWLRCRMLRRARLRAIARDWCNVQS
jgi:hypothetical protein